MPAIDADARTSGEHTYVSVCLRACVRVRARACMCVCVGPTFEKWKRTSHRWCKVLCYYMMSYANMVRQFVWCVSCWSKSRNEKWKEPPRSIFDCCQLLAVAGVYCLVLHTFSIGLWFINATFSSFYKRRWILVKILWFGFRVFDCIYNGIRVHKPTTISELKPYIYWHHISMTNEFSVSGSISKFLCHSNRLL